MSFGIARASFNQRLEAVGPLDRGRRAHVSFACELVEPLAARLQRADVGEGRRQHRQMDFAERVGPAREVLRGVRRGL